MCKPLDAELKRGDRAIQALAKHHAAMGGVTMTAEATVHGALYKITCQRTKTKPAKTKK